MPTFVGNRGRMSNCGCKVVFGYRDSSGMLVMSAGAGQPLIGTIEYCPLHEAAGEMLISLKRIVNIAHLAWTSPDTIRLIFERIELIANEVRRVAEGK